MPRTKHSKNSKRNRDVEQDDALAARCRQFDIAIEQFLGEFDLAYQQDVANITRKISAFRNMLPQKLLGMTLGELEKLNVKTVEEFNELTKDTSSSAKSTLNLNTFGSFTKKSKDDEGYLTEDSNSTTNMNNTASKSRVIPATFSSTKVKLRRSKSACNYGTQLLGGKMIGDTSVDRASRAKFRTPLNGRLMSASADRTNPITPKIIPNTPLSMLRYPKAGETVISLSGSPVVVQSVPDSIANVNIPIHNGMISLRPTRMESVDRDLITRIDTETFNQIKQLQSNLNFIMNYASDIGY